MRDMVTIHDIAREAGVSTATVSRVLSHHPNVSKATYEAVMRVVNEHGYKPSTVARGFKQRRSRTFGIILPNVEHPYYAAFFSAAHAEARAHGYAMMIYTYNPGEQITQDFVAQLIERRLDGVLITGGSVESRSSELPAALNRLQTYMTVVTICPPIPGVECINIYNDLGFGIRQSVRHFAALGHRRIALIGGASEHRSVDQRVHSFLDEMEKLGLEAIDRRMREHTPASGELAVISMLTELKRPQWPTGVIVINDLMALGVMKQLTAMGVRIPEDMAVIGCDNQFFSAYTSPPLTTLDLHPTSHGRVAVQALLSALDGGGAVYQQARESTLIVRESCGSRLGRRDFSTITRWEETP